MSEAVEIYGQFGQTLAFAEATLNKVLAAHLATRATAPERWYALKLTAQHEPIARGALIDGLAAGGKVEPADAEPLIRGLVADGLLTGDASLSLSELGHSTFAELREFVLTPTIRLLGQFDLADIETTIRTMRAVAERAQAQELAVPAS